MIIKVCIFSFSLNFFVYFITDIFPCFWKNLSDLSLPIAILLFNKFTVKKEFTVVLILVITFHIGNMVNSHYSKDINYNYQGIFLNTSQVY